MKPFIISLSLVAVTSFVFAESDLLGSTTSPITSSSSSQLLEARVFTECSQNAIEDRDTKLADARVTYNTAMNSALLARKEAEKKSVAIENEKERKQATKESVDIYKAEVKQIQATLTQARKLAWQHFEDEMKLCRETFDEEGKEDTALKKTKAAMEIREMGQVTGEHKKEILQTEKTVKESLINSIKSLFGRE